MQIKYTVIPSSVGDAWEDVDEAAEALAHITAERLRAAYPGADVQVVVDHKATGYEPEAAVITDDGQVDISVQGVVGRIIEQTWDQFCDSGQEAVLEFMARGPRASFAKRKRASVRKPKSV